MIRMLPSPYRQREHTVCHEAAPEAQWAQSGEGSSLFHGGDFTMALREDWGNETVYVLAGPETDDLQHTLQINVDPHIGDLSAVHYADAKLDGQTETLQACEVLTKGWMELDSGRRAYRALLVWSPTEDRRLYRDQLYVVHEETGYQLSASFTKKTLKTIGPTVDRALRRFEPHAPLRMRGAVAQL